MDSFINPKFDRIMTPRFTKEAAAAMKKTDIREILCANSLADIRAEADRGVVRAMLGAPFVQLNAV